ncbi:MAG TPA: hypothetical protein VEZ70_11260 [Allosphingosinicella sp.]|nr:hypothetical protein [Allosphingosinicella sp.]
MIFKSPVAAMRWPFHAAALALIALAAPGIGGGPLSQAEARSQRGPQQVGGTWDATWQNSRGAPKKGLIVIEQRGAQLSARIESHGNVTATGTLEGQYFTLRGNRMGVPFTITGRVQGKKMSGALNAILVERPFTATKRRG